MVLDEELYMAHILSRVYDSIIFLESHLKVSTIAEYHPRLCLDYNNPTPKYKAYTRMIRVTYW